MEAERAEGEGEGTGEDGCIGRGDESVPLSETRDFIVVYIFMKWSNSIPRLQGLYLQPPILHLL